MARPEAPLGLRERKNLRTQRAIIKATSELTLEVGYAAATIARIAERADVAPRTVTTWFPAKDDILLGSGDVQIERATEFLRGSEGDVVDRLLAWIHMEAERGSVDREVARLRRDAVQHDPGLRARSRELFDRIRIEVAAAAARDAGVGAADMRPQLFAGAAMTFFEQLYAMAADDEERTLEDDSVQAGIGFLRVALAAVTPAR